MHPTRSLLKGNTFGAYLTAGSFDDFQARARR
jgi:hypothetical protein